MKAVDPLADCPHGTEEKVKAATNGGLCPVCLDNALRETLLQLSLTQTKPAVMQMQLLKQEVDLLWRVIQMMTRPV